MRWSAAEEAFLRLRVVDGCLCYGVMGSRLLEKSAFGTVSKILFHAAARARTMLRRRILRRRIGTRQARQSHALRFISYC